MATITQQVVRRARKKYGLTVYHHDDWGSRARKVYAARRRLRPVRVKKADTVAQHITVTRRDGIKADAREVERIGLDRFGSGVSYNFLVDMLTGEVAVGQPLDAKGTHTVNHKRVPGYSYDQNHAARAIAVVGMPGDRLSDKAERAISGLLAAMMDEGAITTHFDYKPHSFFTAKDCPCDPTRDQMVAILRRAHSLRKEPGQHKATNEPSVSLRRLRRLATRARWSRGYWPKAKHDVRLVEEALKAEGMPNYITWQRSLGYKGDDADGVPGEASLKALGRKHGFRVAK